LWKKNYISVYPARSNRASPVSRVVFACITEWITLRRFVFYLKPWHLKYQWRSTTGIVLCATLPFNTKPSHPTITRQRKDVPRMVGMTKIRPSPLLLTVSLPSPTLVQNYLQPVVGMTVRPSPLLRTVALPYFPHPSLERWATGGKDDENPGLPLLLTAMFPTPLFCYQHQNDWRYHMTTERRPTGPPPPLPRRTLTHSPQMCFPLFPLGMEFVLHDYW
jgi:hypothetical protein